MSTLSRPLRLGTRASALATTQSGWVADLLRAQGHEVELVHVRTEGDINRASLSQIGGTGVFAAALREALLAGEVDLAVHSLKDLPTAETAGLVVAAVPEREDPRDALVARDGLTLDELPAGARVGTGSPRRAAQLRELRPDLEVVDIRGNVGTRIGLVTSGELDAVVLAAAGLTRLGRLGEATEILPLERMLPAPGQGALAVECRSDDEVVRAVCASLDDAAARAATTAERAFLARLEAGCTAPVAAHASVSPESGGAVPSGGTTLTIAALVADGAAAVRHTLTGSDPVALGRAAAEELLTNLDLAKSAGDEDVTDAGSCRPERDQ